MLMGHNTIFSPYFRARKVTGSRGGAGREGVGRKDWRVGAGRGKGWGEGREGRWWGTEKMRRRRDGGRKMEMDGAVRWKEEDQERIV